MDTRVARGEDATAALEVWRAALAATGARPSAARAAQEQEALAATDRLLVVAGEPDEVAGLAQGSWVRGPGGEFVPGLLRLERLVVHPSSRGQCVGAALAEALADAGWARGARRLVAAPPDDAARAFLLACGLEPADGVADEVGAGLAAGELVGELEAPVREVVVREAGLRLGQLLKLAGLVDTGAEGKALLDAGGVAVDGEVERRRGRQLQDGEVVVARDQAVRVVLPQP